MNQRVLRMVFVMLVLFASIVCASERPQAFRDLCWGDPMSALGECQYLGEDPTTMPAIKLWKKTNENLYLGIIAVKEIVYAFWDDRLFGVVIEGYDAKVLSQIATAKYGPPKESNQHYVDETYDSAETVCLVEETVGGGKMQLFGKRIMEEYREWYAQQAKEAAKSF